MILKTFAIIHLVIFILTFVLATLIILIVRCKVKKEYGELDIEESSTFDNTLSFLRFTVYALLPIVNLCMCYVMLFETDEIISVSINKILQKSERDKW